MKKIFLTIIAIMLALSSLPLIASAATSTPVITINNQPQSTTLTAGRFSGSLSIVASMTQSGTISFQWYRNTRNSNTNGSLISGATGSSYALPTNSTAGVYYYYCVVRATGSASVTSNIATVTVNPAPVAPTSVTLSPKTMAIEISGKQALTATITPSNASNKNVIWSSSNTRAATVNSSGVVTGVAAGTAIITVTTEDGSKTDTCNVTVKEPVVPVSISLNPTTYTFPNSNVGYYGSQLGKAVTVTNTGSASTGNLSVTLSGLNPSSFTVSPTALNSLSVSRTASFTVTPVTGLAAGTYSATVTVSNANVKASMSVSFTVISQMQANVYYVAKNGSSSGNGSLEKPWLTIQDGINKMPAGSTLIIREGTYNEKLTNIKSGTSATNYTVIKGEDGKRVILNGTGINGGNMLLLKDRNYVRIENLEICNNSVSGTAIGIFIETSSGSTGIQLINNKIYNIDGESKNSGNNRNGHGIAVYGRGKTESSAIKNLLIKGNEVYNCKLGQSEAIVVNGNVTNWEIINNYVHDNDNIGIDAIGGEGTSSGQLDRARNGLIAGNVVVNNNGTNNPTYSGNGGADGIYVDGGKDITIENNYVTGSAYGIEIGSENGSSYRPSGITIRNNVVLRCDNAGILLGGTDGVGTVLVENNTVYQTSDSCIEINTGTGPYTIRNNIILASTRSVNYLYVGRNAGTPVYTNNVYHGGSTSRPSGDSNGQIVSTLPVPSLEVRLTNGILSPNANITAGARLTVNTTPFLTRVVK